MNASRNHGFPKWEQWEEPERRAVLEMCGAQMERYGYASDESDPGPAPYPRARVSDRAPANA